MIFFKVLQQFLLYYCFCWSLGFLDFPAKSRQMWVGFYFFFLFYFDLLCFTSRVLSKKSSGNLGAGLILLVCCFYYVCGLCPEVRGQHIQVGSLDVGMKDWVQVRRLGTRRSYPPSHLTGPSTSFLISTVLFRYENKHFGIRHEVKTEYYLTASTEW